MANSEPSSKPTVSGYSTTAMPCAASSHLARYDGTESIPTVKWLVTCAKVHSSNKWEKKDFYLYHLDY